MRNVKEGCKMGLLSRGSELRVRLRPHRRWIGHRVSDACMSMRSSRRGSGECAIRQRSMRARGHRGQSLGRSAEVVQSEKEAIVAEDVLGSLFSNLTHDMSYPMLTSFYLYAPASEGWPSLSPYLLVLRPKMFF